MKDVERVAASVVAKPGMSERTRRPDLGDVIVATVLIGLGIPLAMSLIFIFIGAPMVMAGVELLTTPSNR